MQNVEVASLLSDQPHKIVEFKDIEYTLLGTAHISQKSADVVKSLIENGDYDAVAIELDDLRYQALTDTNRYRNLDLISIIKQKQTGVIATNLAMSAYQKRLANQLGIEPGAEMKQAIESAKTRDLPVWNIDRNVGITMKRTWRGLSFLEKVNLIFGFGGFFEQSEISDDEIEKLKTGDMLESTFSELSENSAGIYRSLIDERDQFMAAQLHVNAEQLKASQEKTKVLVVIGAGHLKGLSEYTVQAEKNQNTITELNTIPAKKKWFKLLPWLITLVIISGFIWGFATEEALGWSLIKIWLIYNGILSGIGAAVAGGHPLTILAAMLAAPFTSLNPTIAAGMVAALVETMVRKPKVQDFESLQHDAMKLTGWWKNPVTRVLLVFILTNVGSAIATWVSGFKIFSQLV